MNENNLIPFKFLALGTKFRYHNSKKEYVKIGPFTIAEWDEKHKTDNWVGQQLMGFDENDDILIKVFVL